MNKSKDLKDRILQMREDNSIEVSSEMKVLDKTKLQSIEKVDVKDKTLEKKNMDISYNQSQQAFKILANKFNESVSVILELTKRVEKLETLVRLQSMQNSNLSDNTERYKSKKSYLKHFILLLLFILIFYLFYSKKINLSVMKYLKNIVY